MTLSAQHAPDPDVEEPTFEQVFRAHVDFVWCSLRSLGAQDSDVDDLCQEVFLVVHRKLAEFEGRSSIRTWLFAICVRTLSDHRRRARHRRELLPGDLPEPAIREEQHRVVEAAEARAMLERALTELPTDQRRVYELYELEERAMKDVARELDCPVQTAYWRLHAARDHVQRSFAQAIDRERPPPARRVVTIATRVGAAVGVTLLPRAVSAATSTAAWLGGSSGLALKVGMAAVVVTAAAVAVPLWAGTEAETGAVGRNAVAPPTLVNRAPPTLEARAPAPEPAVTTDDGEPAEPADVANSGAAPSLAARRRARPPAQEPAAEDEMTLLNWAYATVEGDPAAALRAAEQHRRQHANGVLAEEREVLAVEALLGLGRAAQARARAQRFRARWPHSSHIPRLERLLSARDR